MPRTFLWWSSISPSSPACRKSCMTQTTSMCSMPRLSSANRFGNFSRPWPCDTGRSIWTCFRSISCYWCSDVVADGSQADADPGLLNCAVSCRTAFWLEPAKLAIGRLVFQPVRLAVAVSPGRLGRSWRRPSRPINRSDTDGVLACGRLPCICPGGNNGDQLASPRRSSPFLDDGAVRSQRQDQSRALPRRASDCARDRRHTVPAAGFAHSEMALAGASDQMRPELATSVLHRHRSLVLCARCHRSEPELALGPDFRRCHGCSAHDGCRLLSDLA